MRWDLLTGGLARRLGGTRSMASGTPSSGVATETPSPPTLPEIDAVANLTQLEEMVRQNRHAMSMAEANLRKQLGDNWKQPDDVGINWNSPTIVNPEPQRSAMGTVGKAVLGAALLASGVGLGSALPWVLDKLSSGSAAPVVTPVGGDGDTQYRLRLGEPDAE